jgi:uncharacterized membrane protein YeaQ/YmgE (transglycosylase-associated protein family)
LTYLYFFAFLLQPAVYVIKRKYRRGVIMHLLGLVGALLGMWMMEMAFTVGMPTAELILLGVITIFGFYGVVVYDCIRLIRSKPEHLVKP